jgi:predicted nucleic-acid-binding protein
MFDTNCLLRLILGDIPAQTERVEALLKTSKSHVHVADLAVAEVVWVLESVYSLDRKDIAEAVNMIIRHPKINSNRVLFERVMPDYASKPAVSFVDICLANYAHLNDGSRLFTFDKKLANQISHAELL